MDVVPTLRHLTVVPPPHPAEPFAAVPSPTVPAADSAATAAALPPGITAVDPRNDIRQDSLPLHRPAGDQDFTAVLAWTAMGWHRPELSEQDTAQAITDSAATLLPQVTAAAVLTRSGSGQLHVTAGSGRLAAVLTRLHSDRRDPPWPEVAEQRRVARWSGALRTKEGWPVASMAQGGAEHGWLVCAPLGRGKTMFGTLLLAIPTAAGEQLERRLIAVAIHGSTAVAAARDRDQLRDLLMDRSGSHR